ncbi:MAG: PKD domain-containing protein [Planctomycetota bacterium]|nr:PKD domain-containing protein [Planctomycetota bacterium]
MQSTWLSFCALGATLFLVAACGGGGGGGGFTPPPQSSDSGPAAQIFVAGSVAGAAGTYQFFGQGADPDCTALTYAWDLDGDGATDDSTLQSPSFSYPTPGVRAVRLVVTDAAGDTAEATCVVAVGPPAAPLAPAVQVRCQALLGEEDMQALFVAEAADVTPGSSIADYNWDFDGDGTVDLTTLTRTVTRTIAGPGQVTVTCRVDSTGGSSSTASLTLFLCDDTSMPDLGPGLQVERDDNAVNTFTTGGTADFIALGADVDGGTLTSIAWDTNDDSVFTDASGRTITSLAWPGPGGSAYRVRARATDDDGKTSLALETVSIVAGPGIERFPSARARAMTVLGSIGTPIQFVGDASDPDGNIDTTTWDLDNDGEFDDGSSLTPTFTYTERGVYTPTLRVEDDTGNVSYAYMTLVVECCTGGGGSPPAGGYWWYDCDDKVIGHGASVFCPLGPPAVLIPPAAGPTQAGVVNCNGKMGIGGDPLCFEIELFNPDGTPAFPPTNPPPPIGANPLGFGIDSTAIDGPPRTVDYTISIRLREPGVRVQILKCLVSVVHEVWTCNFPLPFAQPPDFVGELTIAPGPGASDPKVALMPEIVAIELVNAEQTPQWNSSQVPPGGSAPAGWIGQTSGDGVSFLLDDDVVGDPIVAGQPFSTTPFQIQINSGPPQQAQVRFLDAAGNIVAREPASHGP